MPATSQPAYRVSRLPVPPLVSGHVPDAISGSATWHEPAGEPYGAARRVLPGPRPGDRVRGGACRAAPAPAFRQMPYLSVGSLLTVRNDCTDSTCVLPGDRLRAGRPGCSTTAADLRYVAARADRRPEPGQLRRPRRRAGARLLQRDHQRSAADEPADRGRGRADPAAVRDAARRVLREVARVLRTRTMAAALGPTACSRCTCGGRSRWSCARPSSCSASG